MADRCTCEYVDIGIGLQLAHPDPNCPVHTPEVLDVMTAVRELRDLEIAR